MTRPIYVGLLISAGRSFQRRDECMREARKADQHSLRGRWVEIARRSNRSAVKNLREARTEIEIYRASDEWALLNKLRPKGAKR